MSHDGWVRNTHFVVVVAEDLFSLPELNLQLVNSAYPAMQINAN